MITCINIDRYLAPQFQPVVIAQNQLIYSFEALFRFKSQGRLAPSTIRSWEKSGYIKNIDIAMTRCIRASLIKSEKKIRVAINVSARTIIDASSEYINAVEALLPHTSRVIIEITETFAIPEDKVPVFKNFADECRKRGMRIALDDCSPENIFWQAAFIREIRPDYLKVDGDLLDICFQNDAKSPILHLLRIGKEVGALLVGEKIDSPEKYIFARDSGITLLQGHHFGTPEPLDFNKVVTGT